VDDALKKSQHKAKAAQRTPEAAVSSVCHDTEHQAASAETCNLHQKIERAHQQWIAALDTLDDLIVLYDQDFRILRCNQAYQQCAGIPFTQIIGRVYYEVFPKSNAPLHSSLAATKEITETNAEEEVRIGDRIYRSRALSVNDDHGAYLYTAHTLEDITEQKRTEANLQMFRALLDNSSDAIEVIEPTTLRLLDVNETECRDLGYSREELLSMTIRDIDHHFNADIQKIVEAQMQQHTEARFESVHRRKDGSTFPVEISAKFIELDKPYGLAMVRDITERKQAEAESARLNRIHKTLSDCNHAMLRANNEADLMQDMCETIVASGGYTLAWIGLAQQDEYKSIAPAAMAGTGKEYVEALNVSWDESSPQGRGPIGIAVCTGTTQIVQDVQNDLHFELWREAAAKYGYAAAIMLPLKEDGAVFGTLNIYSPEISAFNDSEAMLLDEVSSDLAFGIAAIRSRKSREQSAKHLYSSLEGTIASMASMVEMRDPYTAGHQHRVAELARTIAQQVGLPDEDIHGIYLATVIHDLGKISIPAEILSKPGKLNKLEYEIIQTHVQAAYDILKHIDFPWPIAQIVYQHHERVDGSGYPNGLKGEEILTGAKIIGVADTVEAMSSHRPYRPGLGIEAALGEIGQHRGTRYDPTVVDTCIKLFQEQGYKLPG